MSTSCSGEFRECNNLSKERCFKILVIQIVSFCITSPHVLTKMHLEAKLGAREKPANQTKRCVHNPFEQKITGLKLSPNEDCRDFVSQCTRFIVNSKCSSDSQAMYGHDVSIKICLGNEQAGLDNNYCRIINTWFNKTWIR